MIKISYIREKGVILLSQRLDKELIFEAYKHVIKMPMKFFLQGVLARYCQDFKMRRLYEWQLAIF